MKYNYKILIVNNDKSKNTKFNNSTYNNTNNGKINLFIIKLIFIFLLIITINYRLNIIYKLNDLYKQEIIEEEESNEQGIPIHQKKSDFWNITVLKNEMHYYSLYYQFKSLQFSFILHNFENNKNNLIQTINQIRYLISQNFSNIEIIIHKQKMKMYEYKKIHKQFEYEIKKNMIKFYIKKENISGSYSSIINLSKGLYTTFIDNTSLLDEIEIQKLYEYIKGKTDNLINISISNKTNIYFFKTKILKDYTDTGKVFNSFNDILNYFHSIPFEKFNYIRISLCPDNNFSKLAYVAMTSILSTKNYNSFICFYLIIPSDFEKHNIKFLESLYEDYINFNISFITIDNRYQKAYTDWRITTQAYYRFSLGELLPNLNKIIYFDTDVIVYKDLGNFYNLNFDGKMILGQATYGNKNIQKKGFHRINTGVLLLNLKAMRDNKFEEKVINIIKKGNKFKYHDQTLLNDYFKEYIGIFPPEFHTRPWSNYKEIKIFVSKIGAPFDKDYFYFSNKYPTVRHFLGAYKPRNPNVNFIEDWWFYARKSKYYNSSSRNFENAFSF